MSELKRRKNESFDAFLRRVKRSWKNSGTILQARKIQFFTPSKSKNVQKKSTVRRVHNTSKTNYLRKIGRIQEEESRFGRR